jgi:WD40 repeat protein
VFVRSTCLYVLFVRPISCLKWLPRRSLGSSIASKQGKSGTVREERLLCASTDGSLAVVDCNGRLVAAIKSEWSIRSLATNDDGRTAFGGCEDGSIRVWSIDARSGALREIFRYPRAHEGACTSVAMHGSLLASGGEDGAIRVWRIVCE